MTAQTSALGGRAAAALLHALMTKDQCDPHNADMSFEGQSELGVTHCAHDAATVRELVEAMSDVVARDFDRGKWRAYRGVLPCGLRLDVWSDAATVPDLAGGES